MCARNVDTRTACLPQHNRELRRSRGFEPNRNSTKERKTSRHDNVWRSLPKRDKTSWCKPGENTALWTLARAIRLDDPSNRHQCQSRLPVQVSSASKGPPQARGGDRDWPSALPVGLAC